jgi:hypothetical protein
MSNESIIAHSLDDYFRSTPIGSIDSAVGNNLYGINHRQTKSAVPSNKDIYGLTFFVRPQLNLMDGNIRNIRQFYPLLTENKLSIQAFVRHMLDPRMTEGYRAKYVDTDKSVQFREMTGIKCPLVDPKNCFIPILTNNLNSISGWPDITTPTFTAKQGLYNQGYSMADGVTRNYETFDLDASFRNTRGDPIVYMFYIWMHYMSYVFEGKLMPYLDMVTENEIDYNSRVYRIVLDQSKQKVTKIAATGACFPIANSIGSFFDYNHEKPFNDQNKDITIRFKCMGVDYQDDILIKEFNETVTIFNKDMKDSERKSKYVKIPSDQLHLFNNRGYPRINNDDYSLEWWIDKDYYLRRLSAILGLGLYDQSKRVFSADASAYAEAEQEEGD